MTTNLYIDGKDIYSAYRILVNKGYDELITFPALKTIDFNDWPEEDGTEFDLSAPAFDTRDLALSFSCHGHAGGFGGLIELLSKGAYHEFDFPDISRKYMLRLVSQPNLSQIRTLQTFSLKFADDFPLKNYTYTAPGSGTTKSQGYTLDGRDLSEYGVCVLQGTEPEIKKAPEAKKNLLQSINSKNGVEYDGAEVFFQTKEVKLSLLMRAGSLTELWRNYDALLFDLAREGERELYVPSTGEEYPCHYKSSAVSAFAPTDKIWLQFSLTLVFNSFRISGGDQDGNEYLLSTEDGNFIITEDGNYNIDMA